MRGGDSAPEPAAATDRPRRPVNLLYDAVGLGMMVYCRTAFHVEPLGFRRIPWHAGPLVISTHRSESDVPLVCSELCGLGHSTMRAPVTVEDQAAFDLWLAKQRKAQNLVGGTP